MRASERGAVMHQVWLTRTPPFPSHKGEGSTQRVRPNYEYK